MMNSIILKPVGKVNSTRLKVENDNWDKENVFIEINSSEFTSEALFGLNTFSHVEILFYMDQVDPQKIENNARHPRNNPDWPKVGG